MGRRNKNTDKSAGRSTASMFRDVDGISTQPQPQSASTESEPISGDKTPTETETDQVQSPDKYDDPYSHPFPFNVIYATQDFLNDHLDFGKSIQLLILIYLVQLLYLAHYELVWKYLERTAMNYTGVLIGMGFSYNLRWRKYLMGRGEKPLLPEFNLIHAVLIPNLYCLKFECNLIENLCFNYFVVENIPIFAKALSATAYFTLYGDTEQFQLFLQKMGLFILLSYALNYINEGDEEHLISKEVENQDIDYKLVQEDGKIIKSGFNTSLSKTEIHLILVTVVNLVFNLNTDNINIIIFQKLVISLILGLIFSYPVFKLNKLLSLLVCGGVFYYFTSRQLLPVLKEDPIFWLILLIKQPENTKLFSAWIGILSVSILIIFNINLEFNLRRKIWHFLILGTVLPSVIINKSFTILGLLGGLIVLIIVEVIRVNKITFLGQFIYDQLYKFQDFKDLKGPLNLSYIYLLIGIGFPLIIQELVNPAPAPNDIKQFIGLISLGIGDAVASIIGKRFGRIKYFGSNKTVEGSLGFFVTNLAGLYYLSDYLKLPAMDFEVLFVTNFLATIFEGVTTMNDNLFLPLMIYIIWEVLGKVVERGSS